MTDQIAISVLKMIETHGRMPELARLKAIEALEKQVPKKPVFEADGYADGQLVYDTWICPCCRKRYEVDYDDFKHCPACGQAIDWGDLDE